MHEPAAAALLRRYGIAVAADGDDAARATLMKLLMRVSALFSHAKLDALALDPVRLHANGYANEHAVLS